MDWAFCVRRYGHSGVLLILVWTDPRMPHAAAGEFFLARRRRSDAGL